MNYNLNFTTGEPVAYIIGGEFDKEIIYVADSKKLDLESKQNKKKLNKTRDFEPDENDILGKNFYGNVKGRLNCVKVNKLQECIKNRSEPDENELKYLYNDALNTISSRKGKEIILDEGEIYPMFDKEKERQVFYVAGKSGSGKSRYIANLIKAYYKVFKNRPCFVFSNKTSDKAFDGIKINRIKLDESLIDDPIKLDEISKSLVVFDDIEYTGNKQIDGELERLKNLILNQGRDKEISFVLVSHVMNNYSKTRNIFVELDVVTIYPSTTSEYALEYLLHKYFGFDKKQIKKIKCLPSKWVTIFRDPFTVVYEKGCYLIN